MRFLDISHGSAHELSYQLSLAFRLEYPDARVYRPLETLSEETCKVLNGLIRALRWLTRRADGLEPS